MKEAKHCNLCGICNKKDEIYYTIKKETVGPRFKIFMMQNEKIDLSYYQMLLNNNVRDSCPAKLDIDSDIIEMRKKMVDLGKETTKNKKMISNLRKYGNPYGDIEDPDKDVSI